MPIQVKTHWFDCKCLLLLWPWQRSNSSIWCMSRSSQDASTLVIKIFQTQKWQFVPPSKVTNMKTFCDHGDLENKVNVKLRCTIKGLVIMHLRCKYQVSTSKFISLLVYGHLTIPLVMMGNFNFDKKNPRTENAVALCWARLVVLTWGVHSSDMGPLGQVVSKLNAFSGWKVENPLIFIRNV